MRSGDVPSHPEQPDRRGRRVLGTARLAGIQAAKRTADLIPLCHPASIGSVEIDFHPDAARRIEIEGRVRTTGRTGVAMEALTAVAVAALTIYDMCKAVEKDDDRRIRLMEKARGQERNVYKKNEGVGIRG